MPMEIMSYLKLFLFAWVLITKVITNFMRPPTHYPVYPGLPLLLKRNSFIHSFKELESLIHLSHGMVLL